MGTGQMDATFIIVGSGMAALHIIARLPSDVLKDTLCIDSSGEWLSGWASRHARAGTHSLRGPLTHSPHKSPTALQHFGMQSAGAQAREAAEAPHVGGVQPLLTVQLMTDFCQSAIIDSSMHHSLGMLKDTVTAITHTDIVLPEDGEVAEGCTVSLASGRQLTARAVIFCASNSAPVLPQWALPVAGDRTQQSVDALQEGGSRPAFPSLPLKAEERSGPQQGGQAACQPQHASEVDVRTAQVEGAVVAIVGSGMTAAQLATQAVARGAAQVLLISRHGLAEQPFSCQVGWFGSRELAGYRAGHDPVERLRAARAASRPATVDAPTLQRLRAAAKSGALTLLEGCHVRAVGRADGRWRIRLQLAGSLLPGGKGLARPSVSATAGRTTASTCASSQQDAYAQDAAQKLLCSQADDPDSTEEVFADALWLATGTAVDVLADPVLRQLQGSCPTRVVGGLPVLDDGTLAWPGLPLFLLGRSALLTLGPAAGEMPGMRMGAERIVRCLVSMHRGYGLPDVMPWASAAARLGGDRGRVDAAPPCCTSDHALLPLLASRVSGDRALPQETVSSGAALRPNLQKVEVAQYTWTDQLTDVCIALTVPEPVPKEQVAAVFRGKGLEVWAMGRDSAYHLHLPLLYGRITPELCRVKANRRLLRVYLLLRKEAQIPWRFLKG